MGTAVTFQIWRISLCANLIGVIQIYLLSTTDILLLVDLQVRHEAAMFQLSLSVQKGDMAWLQRVVTGLLMLCLRGSILLN